MTPEAYDRARKFLMRRDPVLGAAIRQIGACGLADRQRKDHLTALIGAIVSQQLSTKAAATIFGRFVDLFPGGAVTNPADIDRFTDAQLRGVGLSGQKVGYLRDLCARIAELFRDDVSGHLRPHPKCGRSFGDESPTSTIDLAAAFGTQRR